MNKLRLFSLALLVGLLCLSSLMPTLAQETSALPDGLTAITIDNAASVTELAALEGHEGAVNSVAFSPDGTFLASGGEDMVVRLWDIAAGEQTQELEGLTSPVNSLAFNTDGTLLAAGGDTVHIAMIVWNTQTGRSKARFDLCEQVNQAQCDLLKSISFSADRPGRVNAIVFAVVDIPPGQSQPFMGFSEVGYISVLFAEDNAVMWNGSGNGDIDFNSIVYDPDQAFRISGRSDGIGVYVTGSSDNHEQLVFKRPVLSLALNADSTLLAAGGSDGGVYLFTVAFEHNRVNVQNASVLEGHEDDVTGVAFSPDGALLVSSSLDGTLRLWNVETQEEITVLSGADGTAFRSIAFSPDGTLIASADSNGMVRLWGIAGAGEAETGDESNENEIPTEITEIVTSFGTITVNSAKFIDAYPEGCNPKVNYSCFTLPAQGMKILIVYFDGVSDGNAFTDQHGNAYLTDINGNKFEADLFGFDAGLNFYGFAVPESASSINDFSLVWNDGEEVVIPLGLAANDSSD